LSGSKRQLAVPLRSWTDPWKRNQKYKIFMTLNERDPTLGSAPKPLSKLKALCQRLKNENEIEMLRRISIADK
jgi:hypothetical protein